MAKKYHMSLQNTFWNGPFLTHRPIRPQTVHNGPQRSVTVLLGQKRSISDHLFTMEKPKTQKRIKIAHSLSFCDSLYSFSTGSTFRITGSELVSEIRTDL